MMARRKLTCDVCGCVTSLGFHDCWSFLIEQCRSGTLIPEQLEAMRYRIAAEYSDQRKQFRAALASGLSAMADVLREAVKEPAH